MKLVNLTPHELTIHTSDGVIRLAPSGTVARVTTTKVPIRKHGEVQLFRTQYGEVTDLPKEQDGVLHIVSLMVLQHPTMGDRADLAAPGELIRDSDGRPIGCKGLTIR